MLTHSLSRERQIVSREIQRTIKTGAAMSLLSRVLPAGTCCGGCSCWRRWPRWPSPATPSRATSRRRPARPPIPPRIPSAAPMSSPKLPPRSAVRPAIRNASGSAAGSSDLLWRDDLDTAFRHLDLYDRFGCPGQHIQATFRCVVRKGTIDPKAPESLSARVHACWLNPASPPRAGDVRIKPGTGRNHYEVTAF